MIGKSFRVVCNHLIFVIKCTSPIFILVSMLLFTGIEGSPSLAAEELSICFEGRPVTALRKAEIEAVSEKVPLSVQLADYSYLSRYVSPFSKGDEELVMYIVLLACDENIQLLMSEEYPLTTWEKALVLAELNLSKRNALFKISERELLDYYEQHPEKYISADTFYLRHILLHERSQVSNVILKLLLGRDFKEMARIHSKDIATACQGGRLGWLKAEDVPSEFRDRIINLEEGGFYGPLISKYGFHIVQVVSYKKGTVLPFRSIKERVEQDLVAFRVGRMLEELRQKRFTPSDHVRGE